MNVLSEERKRHNIEVGAAIKAFLKANKISVNRLAEESGILANNISRSLSGRNSMPKKVVRTLVEKYGFKESFFYPATRCKISLSLPEEDVKNLKAIAEKKSKSLEQLFLETLCQIYKGEFLASSVPSTDDKRQEQSVINAVLILAGRPNEIIAVGHPAIGTFPVSVVSEQPGELKLFIPLMDNGWDDLSEEQKKLLYNILDVELYHYYENGKKFIQNGYVGSTHVVLPSPRSPFCPDINEIVRLVAKYGGVPAEYRYGSFMDYYVGLVDCVNSNCEKCRFNLSKKLFRTGPGVDFVLCASPQKSREDRTARFEEDTKTAKEFINLPLPDNYPE